MPDKKSNVRKAPRRKPLYALSASSDLPTPCLRVLLSRKPHLSRQGEVTVAKARSLPTRRLIAPISVRNTLYMIVECLEA